MVSSDEGLRLSRRGYLTAVGVGVLGGITGCLGGGEGEGNVNSTYVSDERFVSKSDGTVEIDPGKYIGGLGQRRGDGEFYITEARVDGKRYGTTIFSVQGWYEEDSVIPGDENARFEIQPRVSGKSSNPQAYLLPPLPENANPAGTVVGFFNRAFLDTASNPEIGETISGKRRDLSPTAIEKGVFVDEYEVENLTSFYRGGARVLVGDLASETVDENSSGIGLSIG